MTDDAPQAFLKFLEEPPPDTVVILVLSGVRALPATVISRCQIVRVRRAGWRPGRVPRWARRWRSSQAARAEGVPALFRRHRSPGSRPDRDAHRRLLAPLPRPAADSRRRARGAAERRRRAPRPWPPRRRHWTDEALVAVIEACRAARESAHPQCDPAADRRDGDRPVCWPEPPEDTMDEHDRRVADRHPAARRGAGRRLQARRGSGGAGRRHRAGGDGLRAPRWARSVGPGAVLPDFKRDRLFRRVVRDRHRARRRASTATAASARSARSPPLSAWCAAARCP